MYLYHYYSENPLFYVLHRILFYSLTVYLPDKANPNKGPNISNQAQLNRPFNDEQQERVAFGKEVEIKMKPKNGFHHPPHINGLQRRTPSLDDVLRQVKG